MSKLRTPVYLLIAALSLAVALWQPRDAIAEHARSATTRLIEAGFSLHVAAAPGAFERALCALPLAPR
jgi:hypothetical protein